MNSHTILPELIRICIEQANKLNRDGYPSVTLGPVEFWVEGGDLIYSLPSSRWKWSEMKADFLRHCLVMTDEARAASDEGYRVAKIASGYAWSSNDGVVKKEGFRCQQRAWEDCCKSEKLNVMLCADYMRGGMLAGFMVSWDGHEGGFRGARHGVAELNCYPTVQECWQAICNENGLAPATHEQFQSTLVAWLNAQEQAELKTTPAAKPIDPYEELARKNGYRLHTWHAKEEGNGARDQYFWKKAGSGINEGESGTTFASESETWRSCSIANNLFGEVQMIAESHGYNVHESDFHGFFWEDPSGTSSSVDYETEGEAWLHCCFENGLKEMAEDNEEETTIEGPR